LAGNDLFEIPKSIAEKHIKICDTRKPTQDLQILSFDTWS